MSNHQQMQKSLFSSTAAFTYLHTLSLHYSVVQSPQIFSVFPPWAFWTSDHSLQSPKSPQTIELKLNQLQEWQSPTQLCDSAAKRCFSQELGTQLGARPSGFAVTRDGCSAKRVGQSQPSASGLTAAANTFWHPRVNILW